MRRVLAIINKWWECDPAMMAMLNDNARPAGSPWPNLLQPTRRRPDPRHLPPENPDPLPRAVFPYRNYSAEIWCISDLLEHLDPRFQSSSEQKAILLPKIFRKKPPADLVIAVGTAATPYDNPNQNGNVVVGSKIFMHDAHPGGSNPLSKWHGPFDRTIDSSIDPGFFEQLMRLDVATMTSRFLPVPLNSSSSPQLQEGFDNVGLATINVTDYSEYDAMDPLTLQSFIACGSEGRAASLETTHGIIRVQSDSPFLFVSGITDRLGRFDQDVAPRSYSQDTAAAHNAGLVVSWLLYRFDQLIPHAALEEA
jgi:hypothetical protein